jgi:hypothetical protein
MGVGRWKIVVALVVVGLGLTACSDAEVTANDLEAGDCVEDQDTLNSTEVDSIDCDESHAFEVIGKFDVDDADEYPGADELSAQGDERCQGDIYSEYTGEDFDPAGEYLATSVYPSQETWDEADDRTIICLALPADGSSTTGSIKA